jgi:hypothetical protein
MSGVLRLARNALIAIGIVAMAILLLFSLLAPPGLAVISVTDHNGNEIGGLHFSNRNPFRVGHTFLIFFAGETSVTLIASGYETAEVEIGNSIEVFRGDVEGSSWTRFLHLISVELDVSDPNLKMLSYRGVLTYGGDESPEILAIHPKYRGTHMPLDWLRRQYVNQTGKEFNTLMYVSLLTETDEARQISAVQLDFSHARGGAVEYVPPGGWPAGNLVRRILHSMDSSAPESGYEPQLRLHQRQNTSPYETGATFFYCQIDGHYCAGTVHTFFDRGRNRQQASVEIWMNAQKGDLRLRYPGA